MLYTQKDDAAAKRQLMRVWLAVGLLGAVGCALMVWVILSLHLWGAVGIGVIWSSGCVFLYSLYGKPIRQYRRFLSLMSAGRKNTEVYRFEAISPDISVREGVWMHEVTFTMDDGQERLLFFDDNKEFPALEAGSQASVTFIGHYIFDITPVTEQE
nr:hypothetical protein [bacterium]